MPAPPPPATGEVAAKPFHAQQSKETSPGSLLQCRQGTPIAPTDSQYNQMATPPTRVPLQIIYQHIHCLHTLV